jgi:3-hydroxymyristoyl/3-hydroxydecanoyl-(acyl carrier protein) dehydratase
MNEAPLALSPDHPAYEGHFPGQPILPAVVLLGEALGQVQHETGTRASEWTLAQAKFQRGVAPGTPLTIAHESQAGVVRFEIRSAEGVVASGAFARAPRAP